MKNKVALALILSLIVTADFCLAAELVPNDPDYGKQWYLDQLNMPQVWSQQTGNQDVVIAIIDSGVDIAHPDLRDNIWFNGDEIYGDGLDNDKNGYIDDVYGWDFIDNNNQPVPKYGKLCVKKSTCVAEAVLHGTFVAGVTAAIGNNSQGVAGMNWKAKIMPLRVLDSNGSGSTDQVLQAVNYAVDNGADVINLSFVGDIYNKLLEASLIRAYEKGVVVVVAGGNEDFWGEVINLDVTKMYPVCHQGKNGENILIGVAASDKNNKLADFSNYGSDCIDVLAPGDDFWGVMLHDDQMEEFVDYYGGGFSGTSIAAPVVSGLAALIKSADPLLTNKDIIDLILENADNIDDLNPDYAGKLGHGLINPVKTFQALWLKSNQLKLLKGSTSAIYYKAMNGKRYVFPDQQTYLSWYNSFSEVKQITNEEMAMLPLAGIVTVRPGVDLVKIQTDPRVYAVAKGGVLRWIESEEIAAQLYGPNWQNAVLDVSDAFFVNYQAGESINEIADFDPFLERETVISIDQDKGLF